jgi:hypothetical protein
MISSLSYTIRSFLEKIGVSEWKAFTIEHKISNFEDWIQRHPITIMSIRLPSDLPPNEWVKVKASLDGTNCRLVSQKGIWRKTLVWESYAKIENDD